MKILKIIGWSLGALLFVIIAYAIKAYVSTEKRMHKKYAYTLSSLTLESDSTILREGQRLVKTKDCGGCHGENLAGKVWLHGLNADSTPLLIMPSHEFSQLSEQNMNAINAYCSTLKPIDHKLAKSSVGILGYILTDLGKIPRKQRVI